MKVVGRRGIAAAAVVAVACSGYAAYAANADDPSYRTAVATVGDVEQTLALAGSLEPAGRADLAFATAGTVASIGVTAGQRVKAGAVLGALDDTGLRKAVQQARSRLASARAQLEDDEDAQSEAVSSAASAAPEVGSQPSQPVQPQGAQQQPTGQPSQQPGQEPTEQPSQGPDLSEALAQLAEEQEAVAAAQTTVSASLAAASDALSAQQAACAEATQDCTDALVAVQAAQQQVATDQDALQVALDALASTLSDAYAELRSSVSSTSTGIHLTAYRTVAAETPTGTVTATTIARDQAAIDQARADVLSARQELRMATVTAPFAGEVVEVDAAAGDSVSSGSAVFVLVSRGTTTVEVASTSTQVQQLEVGQRATATPAGSDQALAGTVTQISSQPDDDSAYPVTITLKRRNLDIATGLNASVSVVIGEASDVVTVPASAVTDGSVTVLDDGGATRTPVTTGVTGPTTVAVTKGLEKGDVVVLADLDEPLPTTDDSAGEQRRFVGGPGGVGGVGGPPTVMQFGQ